MHLMQTGLWYELIILVNMRFLDYSVVVLPPIHFVSILLGASRSVYLVVPIVIYSYEEVPGQEGGHPQHVEHYPD